MKMKYLLFSAILINSPLHAVEPETNPQNNLQVNGKMVNGNELLERETETLGQAPSAGADVLLAPGKGLEKWQLRPKKVGWMNKYEAGKLQWSIDQKAGIAVPLPKAGSMDSKKHYTAQRVHVEFRTPPMTDAEPRPSASGNSGIYLQGRYELQICNSFGLPAANNLSGAIYKRRAPDVNAAKKPGEWQAYDIVFVPAVFEGKKKTANACISVKLNGQWIHRNAEIAGSTGSGDRETAAPGPLRLQEHQHLVEFRNVWIVDMADQKVSLDS